MGLIAGGVVVTAVVVYYLASQPAPVAQRLRYQPEATAATEPLLPEGAQIEGRTYVSAYSHAYTGAWVPVLFAVTLTVRNVDPTHPLVLRRVDYHATGGERMRGLLDR